MGRRDFQMGLWLVVAVAVGFVIALVAFGGDNGNNANVVTTNGTTGTAATTATTSTGTGTVQTSTTTTSGATTTPTTGAPTVSDCIALWNQPANRGAQTYLINIAAHQPIRVHVGETSDVPPKCLVTVIGNDGTAYVFPEGGGTTYPYAPGPSQTTGGTLPSEQRKANALEQRDGTLAAS